MASDISKCVYFWISLVMHQVKNTIFVFIMSCLIRKWYWCQWVESKSPAIWPNVLFCLFLDIAGVLKDAPSQNTIFVFIMLCLIGKWYWCWWVESKSPVICQIVLLFVYFWISLRFQTIH